MINCNLVLSIKRKHLSATKHLSNMLATSYRLNNLIMYLKKEKEEREYNETETNSRNPKQTILRKIKMGRVWQLTDKRKCHVNGAESSWTSWSYQKIICPTHQNHSFFLFPLIGHTSECTWCRPELCTKWCSLSTNIAVIWIRNGTREVLLLVTI